LAVARFVWDSRYRKGHVQAASPSARTKDVGEK
jgi:hypothetical protein